VTRRRRSGAQIIYLEDARFALTPAVKSVSRMWSSMERLYASAQHPDQRRRLSAGVPQLCAVRCIWLFDGPHKNACSSSHPADNVVLLKQSGNQVPVGN
jgi:hypothetical protein